VRDRLRGWGKRLRRMVRRRTAEEELREELAFHLEMESAHRAGEGLDPAAARRTARVAFGGTERFKEEVREVQRFRWVEDLRRDLRQAARSFRRTPGFTAAVVATLALGIGANTAIFSAVHGILLKPLPYHQPDRLVRLWETNQAAGIDRGPVAPGTFVDLRSRSRTLESVALYFTSPDWLVTVGETTREVPRAIVSPTLFDLLGIPPILGRGFLGETDSGSLPEETGQVIIGYGFWQREFGGRADVIGQTIHSEGNTPLEIVGVMPAGFDFPHGAQAWTPEAHGPTVGRVQRQFRYYGAVGRLRPDATLPEAQAEATAIARQLEADHPASNAGWGLRLESLHTSLVGDLRPMLWVMLAVVGGVLLIACGNVVNLMLARSAARQREVAVRAALGAERRHLFRHWLVEGALLATLGGVAGMALAAGLIRLLVRLAPDGLPRLDEVTLSLPVGLFTLGITTLTAVVAGLTPAWHARRPHRAGALRVGSADGGNPGQTTRAWLVGGEVALTLMLLATTALLLRSFIRLSEVPLGFQAGGVVTADVRFPSGRLQSENRRPWFELAQRYQRLVEELGSTPGLTTAAGISTLPLTDDGLETTVWRRDAPGAEGRRPPPSAHDQWLAEVHVVTPEYFRTMGIPVHSGRAFEPADRFPAEPFNDPTVPRPMGAAIINEAMARRHWPGQDPLGVQIVTFNGAIFAAAHEIVGVVGDVRSRAVAEPPRPAVYLPFAQLPRSDLSLVVRTAGSPSAVIPALAARLRDIDRDLVVSAIRPLDAVVGQAVSRPRFTLALAGAFAGLALLLAAVGIQGVIGYLVVRRTREIGVRTALGASRGDILRLVLGEGLRPVLLGILVGTAGALFLARGLAGLLFGIGPVDPVSLGLAIAVFTGTATIATLVPVMRALRVAPTEALRVE